MTVRLHLVRECQRIHGWSLKQIEAIIPEELLSRPVLTSSSVPKSTRSFLGLEEGQVVPCKARLVATASSSLSYCSWKTENQHTQKTFTSGSLSHARQGRQDKTLNRNTFLAMAYQHEAVRFDLVNPEASVNSFACASKQFLQLAQCVGSHQVAHMHYLAHGVASRWRGPASSCWFLCCQFRVLTTHSTHTVFGHCTAYNMEETCSVLTAGGNWGDDTQINPKEQFSCMQLRLQLCSDAYNILHSLSKFLRRFQQLCQLLFKLLFPPPHCNSWHPPSYVLQ